MKLPVCFFPLLLFCGCSTQPNENFNVLAYGIWNQGDGVIVGELAGHKVNLVATANELRPTLIQDDWTRKLLQIRPLFVRDEILYYYLPPIDLETSDRVEAGIYAKSLKHRNIPPDLIMTCPRLTSCSPGANIGELLAASLDGELLCISVFEKTVRIVPTDSVSFASWDSGRQAVLVLTGDSGVCNRIILNQKDEAVENVIDEPNIDRVFALEGGIDHVVERDAQLAIYRDGRYLRHVDKGPITCSSYDAATMTLFFLVADEHDGRFVYACKPGRTKPIRLGYAVLNDTLMPSFSRPKGAGKGRSSDK